ncbi:hypothetical protein [Azospirillum sp. B510]|uniref:hypothetical protein n=1 Tax=Azospirillum sp. (strain B510) TaxID=137722 RepID=UPI000B34A36F|nr:hypothetical protein [Azospirillum sp. B510]
MSTKITVDHLGRGAAIYVRQSTPGQLINHTESRRRQYDCVFRRIRPGVSVESAHRFGESAHPNCKLVGAGAEPWIYVMKVVGLVAKHRP